MKGRNRKGPLGSSRKSSNSGGGDDWLMTYADSITLLMAFFVMLFSISKLDHEKFVEITTAIEKELGHREPGEDLAPSATAPAEDTQEETKNPASEGEFEALESFMNTLDSEGVVLHSRPKGFEIELDSTLLYSSGSAELRDAVQGTLSDVGEKLKAFGEDEFEIEVQGHTDSAPINSARYASNWELSAARATGVVRFFIQNGLPSTQLRASAFADTQPKETDGVVAAQDDAVNRRVVIRVTFLGGR